MQQRNLCVGIDVHNKGWKIAVVERHAAEGTTRTLVRTEVPPQSKQLLKFLKRKFPDARFRAVYEAGYHGFSHARQLNMPGIETIVVHPPDIPRSHKHRDRKTDRSDAYNLAMQLSANLLEGIYIPEQQIESDRSIWRLCDSIGQQLRGTQQRIKAFLRNMGVSIPQEYKSWSSDFISWLKSGLMSTLEAEYTLQWHLRHYELLREERKQIKQKLREIAGRPIYRAEIEALQRIPGIGLLSATALKLELMDIRRFRGLNELASYVGLCPGLHASGDRHRSTELSRRGNSRLRWLVIEATWRAVRFDPTMADHYRSYRQGHLSQQAAVRSARKLLRRIRRAMLDPASFVNPTEYQEHVGSVDPEIVSQPESP